MSIGRFISDRRGNVATIFGLSAVPVLLAIFGVLELSGHRHRAVCHPWH